MKAGLIDQGEEYTCQTKVIQFSQNAASSKDFFCHRGQYSVVQW